jgi:uroporphyrin-III C-methyltransferase/precorrin-2 dehydrogenase/sirohydrochlorin ferrochelatase
VRLHPLFLKLEGKEVLVVGAGAVATRKVAELVEAGARVRVVAPEATESVRGHPSVQWISRSFVETDVDGVWLVVAATDDALVQRAVAEAAERRRVFVVAVDDAANASAYGGAVVRRAPLTVAISSDGEAPALVRLLRELICDLLPDEGWVERARALREKWRASGTPVAARFGELVRDFAAKRAEE